MQDLTLKIRVSLLWLFMAVAMSAHSVLAFMEPGAIEEIGEMAMGPGMMLFMALFWWVPLAIAVLTFILRNSANRWTNIVLGIIFTILNIYHLVEHVADPSAHQILIIASTVVATALVVWFAFKLPRE